MKIIIIDKVANRNHYKIKINAWKLMIKKNIQFLLPFLRQNNWNLFSKVITQFRFRKKRDVF